MRMFIGILTYEGAVIVGGIATAEYTNLLWGIVTVVAMTLALVAAVYVIHICRDFGERVERAWKKVAFTGE